MAKLDAGKASTFDVGGKTRINRLGFGAMRVTGPGIWGEPIDRAEAIRTLRRLPEVGVNFIDTANSYGPDVSEMLIREALHPYPGMLVATKAGLTRSEPSQWSPKGDPDYLIGEAKRSCEKLGVQQIGLWQLHRINSRIDRGEQFAAIRSLLDDGIILHAGLSEVSVEDIEAASKVFDVATVHTATISSIAKARTCWTIVRSAASASFRGSRSRTEALPDPGSLLDTIARRHGAAPSLIALAWVLKRSPVMLPIPGTSKVAHLEENVAAADVILSDEEFAALDHEGRRA